MARLGLGLDLYGLCIVGVVASTAQWRFKIFAVGFQMAFRFKIQVKSIRTLPFGHCSGLCLYLYSNCNFVLKDFSRNL